MGLSTGDIAQALKKGSNKKGILFRIGGVRKKGPLLYTHPTRFVPVERTQGEGDQEKEGVERDRRTRS